MHRRGDDTNLRSRDRRRRFDGAWSFAEFEAPDAKGEARRLVFHLDGVEVERFALESRQAQAPPEATRVAPPLRAELTVIVPVYEDFEATRACLTALFSEGSHISTRLIVVDDASPNPRLRAWLDIQAAG